MSVELFPDHKAILNFHHSLAVLEIDLLSYLTDFLSREEYAHRQFDIYVKPTLNQSAFDFIIVEPGETIYILQTPKDEDDFQTKKEALTESEQESSTIRSLYYIFDKDLFEILSENESDVDYFVQPSDFKENTDVLAETFAKKEAQAERLNKKETRQMTRALNPNTNIENYDSPKLSKRQRQYAKSQSQTKQKFKGGPETNKTGLLVKRVVSCANRLENKGDILVVAPTPADANHLKDLITAEDGRSLQELGINVASYDEVSPPDKKYNALFIDEAQEFEDSWLEDLVENYLVPLTDEHDYEYVVMSAAKNPPKVPQIFGRFITLEAKQRHIPIDMETMDIYHEILENEGG